MGLSGLLTLPNHLIGVCELAKLDAASMEKLVQICEEMTEVPADLFTHPYFSRTADLSGWKNEITEAEETYSILSQIPTLTKLSLAGCKITALPEGNSRMSGLMYCLNTLESSSGPDWYLIWLFLGRYW